MNNIIPRLESCKEKECSVLSATLEHIESYFAGLDCRATAHRSLTRDFLPSRYGAGEKGIASELGSFAYGNTPVRLVDELLTLARARTSDIFLDLGCGCGLPVLVAARRVRRAVGVDLLPGVLKVARQAGRDLNFDNVDFIEADMRDIDLGQSSIIFLAATRFEAPLLESVRRRVAGLAQGARLLSVSKPIQSRQLQLRARIDRRFSWGELEPEQNYPIFIYERSQEPGPCS